MSLRLELQSYKLLIEEYFVDSASAGFVHLELASVSAPAFYSSVFDNLITSVNSIGCNEQELATLYDFLHVSDSRPFDPSSAHPNNPLPAQALDQMRSVFKGIGSNINRLHLHTLSFQAIMTRSASAGKIPLAGGRAYLDSRRSVARAALAAFEWICFEEDDSAEHSATVFINETFSDGANDGFQLLHVTADSPVVCWDDAWDMHICVAVMVICKEPKATVGKCFMLLYILVLSSLIIFLP